MEPNIDQSQKEALNLITSSIPGNTVFLRAKGDTKVTVGALPANDAVKIYDLLKQGSLEPNDFYFSVNTFFATMPWKTPDGLPYACRAETNLCRLRAVYLDLDIYKLNSKLSYTDCIYMLMKLADMGIIPRPTILANSGRGVYCIWLIAPEQAIRGALQLYKRINKALFNAVVTALPYLHDAVDKIHDAARVLRLPGSINSKAPGNPVAYTVQYDGRFGPYMYSLDGMRCFFNLDKAQPKVIAPIVSTQVLQTVGPGRVVNEVMAARGRAGGMIGIRTLGSRRLDDLMKILAERPICKGFRYDTLRMLAGAALVAGKSKTFAEETLSAAAAKFVPPYPNEKNDMPISQLVESVYSSKVVRHTAVGIAKFFGLDTDTCRRLFLQSVYTVEIEKERNAPKRTPKEEIRAALKHILDTLGLPAGGTRALADILEQEHGIDISHMTVANHLQAMGVKLIKGRPEKEAA